ncbi:hypothetical protein VTN02DRAFT_3665 [Thermoascus thermophilus]
MAAAAASNKADPPPALSQVSITDSQRSDDDRDNDNDTDSSSRHSQREATELGDLSHRSRHSSRHAGDDDSLSSGSVSTGELHVARSRTSQRTRQSSSLRHDTGPWRAIRKFWTRNVVLTVPQKSNRDHFGAFVRCSLAERAVFCSIYELFWSWICLSPSSDPTQEI